MTRTPQPATTKEATTGMSYFDDLTFEVPPPPPPVSIGEMVRILDELTTVILCHEDEAERIEAAVQRLRDGGAVGLVEVVPSPYMTPGTAYSTPKVPPLPKPRRWVV